jgi:FKBP-type peptidyl-prolyl cis-trans isomerase
MNRKIFYSHGLISRAIAAGLLCGAGSSVFAADEKNVPAPAASATSATNLAAPSEAEMIREYSYMLGRMKAHEFTSFEIYLQPDAYRAGLAEALQRKPAKFSDHVMDDQLAAMQTRLERRAQRRQEEYRQLGVALLEKNAQAEGVKISASSLQYKVVNPGDGALFQDGNVVLVDYIFEANDGKRGPLSPAADSPLKLQVGATPIAGLNEALRLMRPGAIFEIKVPPALAFGARRMSGIRPDTVVSMKLTALSLVQAVGDLPMAPPSHPQSAANPDVKTNFQN